MRQESPYRLSDAERSDVAKHFPLVKFAMSRLQVARIMMREEGREETMSFLAEVLCKARNKFRADRGMQFHSFAMYYMRRQLTSRLRDRRQRIPRADCNGMNFDLVSSPAARDGFDELVVTLPDADARELLRLRYVEQLSTKELATRYGTTPAAIVERLVVLRKKLRNALALHDAIHYK